jgi:pyruvate,orthophosphate dikinase
MSTDVSRNRKLVYRFEEGDASMGGLLGGKGSNLCEMVRLGLPVPPGFVISTEACLDYFTLGHKLPTGLLDSVRENVHFLEKSLGRKFGSPDNPLLVSVRSGSRVSMPGMMDTILNLGINDEVVQGLASMMGDARPAYDAYRRFLQIYSDVVLEMDLTIFENILSAHKERTGVTLDHELTSDTLRTVVADFKAAIRQATEAEPPADPWQQLAAAVEAVFRSWNNARAIFYRDLHGISHDMGTAVTIQAMVFGNQGPTSATGVLFTRSPANGERKIYGEFLPNAQGEDVVAGVRTPEKIANLADILPEASAKLMDLALQLEVHYRDVQDIEFTIETGRLFILQTRSGKRTPLASVTAAVQMVKEGLIGREDALLRVNPEEVVQLLVPQFKVEVKSDQVRSTLLAQGSGASPGAATGKAFFDATRAAAAAEEGVAVILVRPETKPDDIHGIAAAAGVVTSRGGATSHAAVVTRGMGKPCIVGCEALKVDLERRVLVAGGRTVQEGESISMDGTTGNVFLGEMETVRPALEDIPEAIELLGWADEARKLGVWANADTPTDATQALAMGAEGIGLCRTEHMFLDLQRLPAVRRMLLSADAGEQWRQEHPELAGGPLGTPGLPPDVENFFSALAEVLQLQTDDFTQILRVMGARPVIIRLLDAPLHEFLPAYDTLLAEVVELRTRGTSTADELREKEAFLSRVEGLREENPMLGHRGCRLGLTFPAIYEMQVEAIITASANLVKEGLEVHPEIMIPLTVHVEEMIRLRRSLTALATRLQERLGVSVPYKFGTMIETPRGAITAGDIAQESDFFSFGTNDLTQMTFGFSRDDAEGKFLRSYVNEGILPADPFATMDTDGVGALVRMAVQAGRQTRPDLEIGICGEHGGDPASVRFCHHAGLDYVSCSPFRVPVARLAAAQAALPSEKG